MAVHSIVGILFLGVMSVCLVTLTLLVLIVSRQLRRVLLRIQTALLPACEETLEEARRTFAETRQLISHTNKTTHHVEEVVHKTCEGASAILDNLFLLKERAQAFLKERFGNGSRPKSRRVIRG